MLEEVLDQWQITLKQKKNELERCQQEKHLTSCLKCEKILDCTVRDSYIEAVYDSMNKGKSGGFEF